MSSAELSRSGEQQGQQSPNPEDLIGRITYLRQAQDTIRGLAQFAQNLDGRISDALKDSQLALVGAVDERVLAARSTFAALGAGSPVGAEQIVAIQGVLGLLQHPEYLVAIATRDRLLEERFEEEAKPAEPAVEVLPPAPVLPAPPALIEAKTVFVAPEETASAPATPVEYRAEIVGGELTVNLVYPNADLNQQPKTVVLSHNQQILLAHMALWTKLRLDQYTEPWITGRRELTMSTGWSENRVNDTKSFLNDTGLFEVNKLLGYRLQAAPDEILAALSGESREILVTPFKEWSTRVDHVLLPAYLQDTLKAIDAMVTEGGNYLENKKLKEKTKKSRELLYRHLQLLTTHGLIGRSDRGNYRIRDVKIDFVRKVLDAQKVERTITVTVKEPPTLARGRQQLQLGSELVDSASAEAEEKRPPQEQEGEFRLPTSGMVIRGLGAKLLRLLSEASMDKPVSARILIESLYPSKVASIASTNLSNLIARIRSAVEGEGWTVENLTSRSDRGRSVPAKYYLKQTTPKGDNSQGLMSAPIKPQYPEPPMSSVPLAPPVPPETLLVVEKAVEEALPQAENAEFGTLSREDVAVIAAAMSIFYQNLVEIFSNAKTAFINKAILDQLVEKMMPEEELQGEQPKDRNGRISQMRSQALTRVTALLGRSDIDLIFDAIFEKNEDVWELLMHLQEIKDIGKVSATGMNPYQDGLAFLTVYLVDANVRNQSWSVEQEMASQPEGVVLQETSTPVAAVVSGGLIVDKTSKPISALEKRDPDVRSRITALLDGIMAQQELQEPVSPGLVTRAFPTLKEFTIDNLSRFVSSEVGPKWQDQRRYNAWQIAALLYLHRHGKNLPSGMKRDVEKIAKEEYEKRLGQAVLTK